MFVTLLIILKYIIKGVILSFLMFFYLFIVFSKLFMEGRQLERRLNLIIFRFLWNIS